MKLNKMYRFPLYGSAQKVSLTFRKNGDKAGVMYRMCFFMRRRICQLNFAVFDGRLLVSAYLHEIFFWFFVILIRITREDTWNDEVNIMAVLVTMVLQCIDQCATGKLMSYSIKSAWLVLTARKNVSIQNWL